MATAVRPNKRQRQEGLLSALPDPKETTLVRVGDLVVHEAIEQPPILSNSTAPSTQSLLLHNLLHPLPESDFLNKYFRESAVHIPALAVQCKDATEDDKESRMDGVVEQLADLDPAQLFQNTASESIFVWLKTPTGLINSIEVSDPDTALALYQAGNATYCRAPEPTEQLLVSALLQATGLGCGQYDATGESMTSMGRGEVEVFLSAVNGHVTDWHFDFQENFTLQLSGRKQWTVQKGTVKHPTRGCTPHYASPATVEPQLKAARLADPTFEFGHPATGVNAVGPVETVVLEPGDVFYHPAGMWHKIEVLEPGVSINISLMATNYATLTCQALQHLLLQQDEWRAAVVRDPTEGVLEHLQSLLTKLPGIIQNFAENGGAQGIIPPVLQHETTPAQVVVNGEDKGDGDEEEVESADGEEDVVNVSTFQVPANCQLGERTNFVYKNPLATLIRERDITKFYSGGDDVDVDSDADNIYVLNVNFAGNESHESSVRVRFKDDENNLQFFINAFESCTIDSSLACTCGHVGLSTVNCLVYYGFLLWNDIASSEDDSK